MLYHHNNGNFLKLVELIAKFDDLMSDHLMRIVEGSQPRQTHYLSKDIQKELISLLYNAIRNIIMPILKQAKYCSYIANCTPDVSHVKNHRKYEGKIAGVQNHILGLDSKAFFIPCTSHTLNLAVNDAAMAYSIGVAFFDTIQKVYVLFLHLYIIGQSLRSNDTRWEVIIDAICPLRCYIKHFYESLLDLVDDIKELKFLCCLVVWHYILNEINVLSKMFQKVTVELATTGTSLEKVTNHLEGLRNDDSFKSFLVDAKTVAEIILEPKPDSKVKLYFFTLDAAIASSEEEEEGFEQTKQHSSHFEFQYDISKLKNCPNRTVASEEQSLSKLKLIEIYLRFTMFETQLNAQATISIEQELGEKLKRQSCSLAESGCKPRDRPARAGMLHASRRAVQQGASQSTSSWRKLPATPASSSSRRLTYTVVLVSAGDAVLDYNQSRFNYLVTKFGGVVPFRRSFLRGRCKYTQLSGSKERWVSFPTFSAVPMVIRH
ncbi:hypothetical protein PR048_030917 [Dryococelus australis]|uniref:Uncharacterized protein n=1 Tax=Dryococelus australis TaxID=614101 RepID=A0ABQ9GAZ2_9NEOP|nr:hypothetical protein PR048_030917 [Dryococelus australis]